MSTVPAVLEPQALLVEQAKGALMFRYGITSYEALGVLLRWSRESGAGLTELSRALTHGVCQGRATFGMAGPWLVRWVEQRLRNDLVDDQDAPVGQLRTLQAQ
ncbi:ANTAR domain-containing protein [Nocardioides pakistanensis]